MTEGTMFSSRTAPWMTLGQLVDEPVTAKEAATLGKLDFEVEMCPAGFMKDGKWHEVPGRNTVVRKDTNEFMSFTSSKIYRPLQYGDAFGFMDGIDPKYVAAGTLRKGRQGFMVVKTPLTLNVLNGQDPHDLYAVLRTSHDMSRATEILVMPLRGKCMNQLTLKTFSHNAQYRWSIKHNTTQAAKLAEAQESLSKIGIYCQRFEELADKLVDTKVTNQKASQLLKIVIPQPKGKTEKVALQHAERIQTVMELWQESPTVAYAGTAWGLVNAVSEYWDWHRTGGTPESQFLNALEGDTHKKLNKMAGLLLSGV